jgi:DNA modification methylase
MGQKKETTGMKIQQKSVEKIKPYPNNPRKNDRAVEKVAMSLQEYGWQQPIVVDKAGVIIVGHTRWLAAKHLGLSDCPVVVASHLTPEQVKAYRIADNRTGELAEWDQELLEQEIRELLDQDYAIDLTGFCLDDFDFDKIGGGLSDEDSVLDVPENAVTRPGDMWSLGEHRILCGDSTKPEDVARVLQTEKPLLMVTDPPYGVEYDADWRNKSLRADGNKVGDRAVGKVENDNNADWSEAWALFSGDVAYVWHAMKTQHAVACSLLGAGFGIRAEIVWAKSVLVISQGHYHPQHESCFYAVRKGEIGHWAGDRKQTTLWQIDKPRKSETGHSTQKPVECMARPIRNHDSELVYEPFSGSGTTIIACEQLKRKCRAIELSPAYVDVAVQRWADFTGQVPVRHDGVKWSELTKE